MQIYVISLCAITLNNINWMRGINLFGFIHQNWGWLLCVSSTIVSSIRSSVPLPNIKIGAHTQQKPAFPIAGWLLHQNVAPTSKFITACLLSRHSTLPSPPRLIVALFLFDDGGGHPSISLTIERWCRHVYTWDSYFLARNIMKSEIIMTYHSAESQHIASLVYVWYKRVMRCQGGMLDGICCCTGSRSGQMSWNFCFVVAATQFWPTQSLCWRLRCSRRWGWGLMKSRMEGEEISDNGWCWLLAVARNIDHG